MKPQPRSTACIWTIVVQPFRLRYWCAAGKLLRAPCANSCALLGSATPNAALVGLPYGNIIEIIDRGVTGLNLAQPALHLVAVLQPPLGDGLLQAVQRILHAVGKTTAHSLLFFLAACGAA